LSITHLLEPLMSSTPRRPFGTILQDQNIRFLKGQNIKCHPSSTPPASMKSSVLKPPSTKPWDSMKSTINLRIQHNHSPRWLTSWSTTATSIHHQSTSSEERTYSYLKLLRSAENHHSIMCSSHHTILIVDKLKVWDWFCWKKRIRMHQLKISQSRIKTKTMCSTSNRILFNLDIKSSWSMQTAMMSIFVSSQLNLDKKLSWNQTLKTVRHSLFWAKFRESLCPCKLPNSSISSWMMTFQL